MNGVVFTQDGERVQVAQLDGVLTAEWRTYHRSRGWQTHHEEVVSVEAAKGKPVIIVLPNGATVKLAAAATIRCTSRDLGEYDAHGFWAGPS